MIAGEAMQRRVASIALAATLDSGFALEARDYLDVDAIRRSGRFSDEQLLTGAAEHDDGFDRQVFAQALRQVGRIGVRRVREYGVTEGELAGVRDRLTAWASEVEAAAAD